MAEPQWVPVNSSNLEAVAYDADSQTLTVRFLKGGREYSYVGVSPEVAKGLVQAESPGRYFRDYIRGAYQES